eukprot:COSAG02_NODE_31574_length_531_cov_0.879630_1_plen_58_part_10
MTDTCATEPNEKPLWKEAFLCIAVARKKAGNSTTAERPHTIGPNGISAWVASGMDSPI